MVMVNRDMEDYEQRLTKARADASRLADDVVAAQKSARRAMRRLGRLVDCCCPATVVRRECSIIAERILTLGRLWEHAEAARQAARQIEDEGKGDANHD